MTELTTREITTHRPGGETINDKRRLIAVTAPGAIAPVEYFFRYHSDMSLVEERLKFVTAEAPVGWTNEALIAIVLDRLQQFQGSSYKCHENESALEHLYFALRHLHNRTRRRVMQGVEGKPIGEQDELIRAQKAAEQINAAGATTGRWQSQHPNQTNLSKQDATGEKKVLPQVDVFKAFDKATQGMPSAGVTVTVGDKMSLISGSVIVNGRTVLVAGVDFSQLSLVTVAKEHVPGFFYTDRRLREDPFNNLAELLNIEWIVAKVKIPGFLGFLLNASNDILSARVLAQINNKSVEQNLVIATLHTSQEAFSEAAGPTS